MYHAAYSVDAGDVHFDRPLSNLSIAFRPDNFIADKMAPIVKVDKQSDLYTIWDKAEGMMVRDTNRAPGTTVKRRHLSTTSAQYYCNGHAWGTDIPLEILANADNKTELIQQSNKSVLTDMHRAWEDRVKTMVTNTSNVGSSNTLSGANQWTDQTDSTPLQNIEDGMNSVFSTTGYEANKVLFGRAAWRAFRTHPEVLDRLFDHGSGNKQASIEQVKDLLEVDEVIVGNAIKNTADEGVSGSYSQIWGGNVLIYFAPKVASLLTPSYLYSFRWRPKGFPAPFATKRGILNRVGEPNVMVIESFYYQTEKVINSEMGFLIVDAA